MTIIVHIIERLLFHGGTSQKLLYLTKYCNKNVKHIFLCYQSSEMISIFNKNNAIIDEIDSISVLDVVKFINKGIKKYKPNVVCTHFTRPLITGYISSKILNNTPIIHNEHSSAYYRKGLGFILSKYCLPNFDSIICNSEHTMSSIKTAYPSINTNKLQVIYNPVEKRLQTKGRSYIRSQLNISTDDILIGHIGAMIEMRDQKTLVKAFHKICFESPKKKLVFVGTGALDSELKKLVSQLGLDDLVIFCGNTSHIGDFLSAFDIYVNPTLDEGFGIAVVEAMLANLPVILANCGAHPELIENDKSGLLYQGGNESKLAESLLRLINNRDFMISLGKNASERAQRYFSPQRFVDEYIKTVMGIVNSNV